MPTRIYWEPLSELSPTSYEVSAVLGMDETWLSSFPHAVPGANWNGARRQFFFDDPLGTDARVYRVRALGPARELYGDTGPFQPSTALAAVLATRVRVDHNWPTFDNLRVVAQSGMGIPEATVRVFRAPDWDANRRDVALAVTTTDVNGAWKTPVWLEPGMDYVLVGSKEGAYGPNERRITV